MTQTWSGKMADTDKIWKYLTDHGCTEAGAAGLMGNLQHESGMVPNRVEILCLKRLREQGKTYTDKTYTAAVDSGMIPEAEFIHPLPGKQYGYGLAQWTAPARKESLYLAAKNHRVSIGDIDMQLEFLVSELKISFASVWETLTTTDNVQAASDAVLLHFECPANAASMSVARANTGYAIYAKYHQVKEAKKVNYYRDTIISQARAWIGRKEADGSHKEIIDIYNAHKPLARGYAVQYTDSWCAAFVSAVAIKCGYTAIIPTECGCPEMIEKFKLLGEWVEDDNYTPKAGDVIFFDWQDTGVGDDVGTADHVGFVETVSSGIITTIEGNKSDSVSRRKIAVGARYIRGYGVPKYTAGKSTNAENTASGGLSMKPKWVGEVTAQSLNVRTWAGTEYPNIKSYPELAITNLVDVCDTVKAADGSVWYYIRIAGKYYGFVSAKYIKKK